ncbi:MAG: restriction endonuclease, partial [Planctomycetaceae bacterium]
MSRAILQLRVFRARHQYECAFCQSLIQKGQYYYRDDPHPMARYHRGQTARQICVNCVQTDGYFEEHRPAGQLEFSFEEQVIQPVRVELVDVSQVLLERLRLDPDEMNRISASQFEEFICERLSAMGFEARQVGHTNRKDGGIDVVFWNHGPFPVLGAAQVTHHRDHRRSNGSPVVRDFCGVLATHPFQFGLVVTNTTFTADARWFVDHQQGLVRLRDGEDLRRWIYDEFVTDEQWRTLPRRIELCPGIVVDIP